MSSGRWVNDARGHQLWEGSAAVAVVAAVGTAVVAVEVREVKVVVGTVEGGTGEVAVVVKETQSSSKVGAEELEVHRSLCLHPRSEGWNSSYQPIRCGICISTSHHRKTNPSHSGAYISAGHGPGRPRRDLSISKMKVTKKPTKSAWCVSNCDAFLIWMFIFRGCQINIRGSCNL